MSGRALLPAGPDEWPVEGNCLRVQVVSMVCDGQVRPMFVARPEHALGAQPFRGYVIEAADPILGQPDVDELVRAMHDRSGPDRGITATTLSLKGDALRGVATTEVPAEAAVLRAGELATGIDLVRARATLSAGEVPQPAPCRRSSAGVRALYPQTDLTLKALRVELSALPGGIWAVEALARPGETVCPPAGTRMGRPLVMAVSVGEDSAACRRALDLLPRALRVLGRQP